jgi:hypothetical protein
MKKKKIYMDKQQHRRQYLYQSILYHKQNSHEKKKSETLLQLTIKATETIFFSPKMHFL